MCGIGGFWGDIGTRDPRAVLDVADRCLRHRGPDQGGRYTEPGVGLAIRRLSVIDLLTGEQPVASEDGQVVTVFNGEIYNHHSLRQELEGKGHTFRSRTDTEVIVHLYEEHGLEFLHRLNGMFAIALWDRRKRRLVLARDRLGIKPLHYSWIPGGLLFASEIAPLLAMGASDEPDHEALGAYFRLGYVPSPATAYSAIRSLPPGSRLVLEDESRREERWWNLASIRPSFRGTLDEAREQLRASVRDAVRARMASDVPLGAFLSGGLDSSLVVGVMAGLMDRPVDTFTIGFDEQRYDETSKAHIVSTRFRTNAHVEKIMASSLDVIEDIIQAFGQPFADPSAVPMLFVSRLARRHVTVALSGDGGDELFGGYTRYATARAFRWLDSVPTSVRSSVARLWPKGRRGAGFLRIAAGGFGERYLENGSLLTPLEGENLLDPEISTHVGQSPYRLAEPAVNDAYRSLATVEDLLHLDLHSYLPDVILAKVDRMSMSCSLEARVPLLDHELVEFVFSLPLRWRMGDSGSKRLMRETFRDLYPETILGRKKMGFGVPLGAWLSGPLQARVMDLSCSEAVRSGPLRREGVEALVAEHMRGERDRGRKLWALMVFDAWWRKRGSAGDLVTSETG